MRHGNSGVYMSDVIAHEEKVDNRWLEAPALFAERLSKGSWVRYRHLDYVSRRIAQVATRPVFLIINMPPRHGKSELISHWTPVWYLKRFPYRRIILCSYQSGFATEWGGDAKNTFIDNEEELGLTIRQDTKSKARWRIKGYGGGMTATGIGGPITGKGGDLIIIDDPIKSFKEALSPVYRENIKQWYRSTLRTRLQPGGSIIILMTRWHEDDLCGWLLGAAEEEGVPMDKWEVINLKAVAEPTETEPDPLGREEGEALCPDMYPIPELDILKGSVGTFWWDAEYQGHPRPEGGGTFKEGWFGYFDPDEFEDLKLNRYLQQWDTAFKEKQVNDRSACITFAEGRKGYYVLDLWVGRPTFPELTEQAKTEYSKWVPDSVQVEDKASGISLIQQLRRDTKIPIRPVKAVDDKVSRANSVSGIVEAGRVFLPRRAPWLSTFLSEVCGFPSAAHDDITDVFVYGLMFYKPRRKARLGRRGMSESEKSRFKG
jgi:predicted phage terminase large subunit-like protein